MYADTVHQSADAMGQEQKFPPDGAALAHGGDRASVSSGQNSVVQDFRGAQHGIEFSEALRLDSRIPNVGDAPH
jgi:hypothetical protein